MDAHPGDCKVSPYQIHPGIPTHLRRHGYLLLLLCHIELITELLSEYTYYLMEARGYLYAARREDSVPLLPEHHVDPGSELGDWAVQPEGRAHLHLIIQVRRE